MAIRDIFKVSRKTFFNPTAWLDVDSVSTLTRNTWGIIRDSFRAPAPHRRETFEQAVKRQHLTAADLRRTAQNYFNLAIIFLLLGVLVVIFSIYLIIAHFSFSGLLLGMAVSTLFFAQSFRYHFWYFQIKHKKLGCTFEEWRSGKVKHKAHS